MTAQGPFVQPEFAFCLDVWIRSPFRHERGVEPHIHAAYALEEALLGVIAVMGCMETAPHSRPRSSGAQHLHVLGTMLTLEHSTAKREVRFAVRIVVRRSRLVEKTPVLMIRIVEIGLHRIIVRHRNEILAASQARQRR